MNPAFYRRFILDPLFVDIRVSLRSRPTGVVFSAPKFTDEKTIFILGSRALRSAVGGSSGTDVAVGRWQR